MSTLPGDGPYPLPTLRRIRPESRRGLIAKWNRLPIGRYTGNPEWPATCQININRVKKILSSGIIRIISGCYCYFCTVFRNEQLHNSSL